MFLYLKLFQWQYKQYDQDSIIIHQNILNSSKIIIIFEMKFNVIKQVQFTIILIHQNQLIFQYITLNTIQYFWRALMQAQKNSSIHLSTTLNKVTQFFDQFTQKQYLQKHSLFANLYSSQAFSLSCPQQNTMELFFGKDSVQAGQLYEYNYFHRRDKKVLLLYFMLMFLQHGGKSQICIIENVQRINKRQIIKYITNPENGGNIKLAKQFDKRVHYLYSNNSTAFKFNLNFLSLLKSEYEFLKCIIISDVNSFQSNDKMTLQKYYKKIPKQLAVISFRKDLYDYKVIQKAFMPQNYRQDQGEDYRFQLNQKIVAFIKRDFQPFNSKVCFIMPVEFIGVSNKNIDQTYRSALIRGDKTKENKTYFQYTYKSMPVTLQTFRKVGQ